MATICLNMIVKNEAPIIEDALENILAHIPLDYWVIADTGSDDDTAERITHFFAKHGIKGEMLHHAWKHFGHNRQLALQAAQGKSDYVFFFDADDRFEGDIRLPQNPDLHADAYAFKMCNQHSRDRLYDRRLLVKNDGSWRWRGAVHEQLFIDRPSTQTHFDGDYVVVSGRFGARSRNPQRYYEDALLLEQVFAEDSDDDLKRQNAYFCGQSYRDAGMREQAARWLRISLDFCEYGSELRRHVLMSLAAEYVSLKQPEQAVYHWLLADDNSPANAEAAIHLAEYFLQHQAPRAAFDYAAKTLDLPAPDLNQSVTVDQNLYRYGRHNAHLRAALALAHYDDALASLLYLAAQPEHSRELDVYLLKTLSNVPMQQRLAQQPADVRMRLRADIEKMAKLTEADEEWRRRALQGMG